VHHFDMCTNILYSVKDLGFQCGWSWFNKILKILLKLTKILNKLLRPLCPVHNFNIQRLSSFKVLLLKVVEAWLHKIGTLVNMLLATKFQNKK
jgi:hypothetical protein